MRSARTRVLLVDDHAVVRAGYDPMSGVDSKIEAKFKERGIKPNGFETAEEQNIFPMMPAGKGLSDLIETWGAPEE